MTTRTAIPPLSLGPAIAVCALIASISMPPRAHALTPLQEFESDAVLAAAKAEIKALAADQLEATISYLADCGPLPSPDRDTRCERSSTVLTIKTWRAGTFHSLRLAIFALDKVAPWNRASRTPGDDKLFDRRIKVFAELRDAAADRYASLIR